MRCLLTSVFCWFNGMLFAQYSYQNYSPAGGLVDARVQKIFQDSRGILYFLTREGFSRFDGQRFSNFTQLGNSPLSIVNDMLELDNGEILVSALSGIYRLRQNQLYKDSTALSRIVEPGDFVPLDRNQFLLASNSGHYFFNGQKAEALSPDIPPMEKMLATGNGLLGIGQTNSPGAGKLFLFTWPGRSLAAELDLPGGIRNILRFGQTCFFETATGWQELDSMALHQGKLKPRPLYFKQKLPAGFAFQQFHIDHQDHIWLIQSQKGLCRIDGQTGQLTCYSPADGLLEGVIGVFQDAEMNYWFLAPGKGLQKLLQSGISLLRSSRQERPVFQDRDLTDGALIPYTPKPGIVQSFYWNRQRWLLLSPGAIENGQGRKIIFPGNPQAISNKPAFDRQNRLLIAGSQLTVIDASLRTWQTPLPYFTDRVAVDEENNYWCFARNGDILVLRLQPEGLIPRAKFHEPAYSARDALHWRADSFCIGTRNNGLVLVKANTQSYRYLNSISTAKGLSNHFVSGLMNTGSQTLLVATVTGLDLVHFSPADTAVEQLYGRINLFSGVAGFSRLRDGTLLALNDDGSIYRLNLSTPGPGRFKPKLFFHRILVNGEAVEGRPNETFAYNRNNFRFQVSAPSFMDEKNIRFLFRLSGGGLEKEQNSHLADFDIANLPPGAFELRVNAYFPGNQYPVTEISYRFSIRKPFWKTTGFMAAAFIVLVLSALLLFRSILQRKLLQQRLQLEKEKAIAAERTRIATDMHDELGAGISTIKYLSQSAPYIAPEVQQANNLKIAAQADALVDKMNDIIWAMNERNDSLDSLIYYCKAWVTEYADAHQTEVRVELPATIPQLTIRGENRQHIFLCIKEAVHNIIKHAAASAIQLSFSPEKNQLRIVVSDNGSGFDPEKVKPGNGLFNMKKRMGRLNGRLEIESGTGGTRLQFIVPV